MTSRAITTAIALLILIASGNGCSDPKPSAPAKVAVAVYKTATCGCCNLWVDHLRMNGFEVEVKDVAAADVRAVSKAAGLEDKDTSCHTAKIGDYVVEGHVPAADIQRLLAEKPAVAGIAVPGMPLGSPGMDQGSTKQPYDVIAFTKDGKTSVFAHHP